MFPTIATILGDSQTPRSQPQDGIDILPAIEDAMNYRKEPIGFAYEKKAAWMTQQYKLVVAPGNNTDITELYDLKNDPYETTDLAGKYPEKVSQMKNELTKWIQSCNRSSGTRYEHLTLPK